MQNKKFPPIFRILLLMVISLVVGINIYSWNARSLTGNAMPMPFGYGAAVVLSGSMEPTIMVDELIIVKTAETYEVDDIVVYQTGRMPVVHRIVAMDGETVTTRGDANNTDDSPVELSQVKGKVISHIPHVGKVVRLLKTPPATILLIVAAVLMVELPYMKEKEEKEEELARIKEEIRRLKEEQES